MSRPRKTYRPVFSAIALALLPSWACGLDLPSAVEPARETTANQPSVVRRFDAGDLLCTSCEPKAGKQPGPPQNTYIPRKLSYAFLKSEAIELALPGIDESRSAQALSELQFRDNQPLVNRLKRIQAWPLLTIWDSKAATLYVGVNRDGEPGVHLRQKRKDRGSLAPPSRFVLIASSAASGDSVVTTPRR